LKSLQKIQSTDLYKTIEGFFESNLKVKGSTFIAQAYPSNSKEEAEKILQNVRTKYYDATHHCFAYKIGKDGLNFRYSDDGEPNGTAGKQIFQAINHFELSDILVIVIRYFGGTKLGVGPLARAYYDSAFNTLSNIQIKNIYLTSSFEIICDYNSISFIKKLLEEYSIEWKEEYLENVKFTAKIIQSAVQEFEKQVIELTNGKVKAKKILE
jgi:uncharacterized YigZ family protein